MITPYLKKDTEKNRILLCHYTDQYGVMLVIPHDKRSTKVDIFITFTNGQGFYYALVKHARRYKEYDRKRNLEIFCSIVDNAVAGKRDWRNAVKVTYTAPHKTPSPEQPPYNEPDRIPWLDERTPDKRADDRRRINSHLGKMDYLDFVDSFKCLTGRDPSKWDWERYKEQHE